jgi:hypothetical protein
MKANYLKAYVGNGTKLHIGYEYELPDDKKMLMVVCGSKRSGTRIFTNGILDLATYSENTNACEKCVEREAELLQKEKVVA